jgi:hypothetical protein
LLRYFLVYCGPFYALSAAAFARDKQREAKGIDNFQGDRLFHRYGHEVSLLTFSIPVNPEWGTQDIENFSSSLQSDLAAAVRGRLPEKNATVIPLRITDTETFETKEFVRILVRSKFGSMVTHFVHYATLGKTLTAHYFTFARGTYTSWQVAKFILLSPVTIWFWGLPWLHNHHSILARISKYRASSFDGIDLRTMLSLTQTILETETVELLAKAGVLTDEIKTDIHNHFTTNISTTYANKQRFRVSNSPGINLGNLGSSIHQTME